MNVRIDPRERLGMLPPNFPLLLRLYEYYLLPNRSAALSVTDGLDPLKMRVFIVVPARVRALFLGDLILMPVSPIVKGFTLSFIC